MKIIPHSYSGLTCSTNCIITILKYLNINERLSYYDSWIFNEDVGQHNTFFQEKTFNIYKSLVHKNNIYNINQHIENCIKNNIPIIASMDHFYCDWHPNFKQSHTNHFFIINDFNKNTGILTCVDPTYEISNGKTSIKNFAENFNYISDINLIEILLDLFSEDEKDILEKFKVYFESIKTSISKTKIFFNKIEFILNNCDSFDNLFFYINKIKINRFLFAKFIGEKININYYDSFMELGSHWNVLRNLIYKYNLSKDKEAVLKSIVSRCDLIYTMEKDLYDKISIELQTNCSPQVDSNNYTHTYTNVKHINLSNYINNRGFGNTTDKIPDMCYDGGFYEEDFKNKIECNEETFFCIKNEKYDNISCNGQIININSRCKSISFLTCSEWGSTVDKIEIICKNETFYKPIKVSNWAGRLEFGETIAFQGRKVDIDNDAKKISLCNFLHNMYYVNITLEEEKDITAIKLPIANNLHIWAININY